MVWNITANAKHVNIGIRGEIQEDFNNTLAKSQVECIRVLFTDILSGNVQINSVVLIKS